MSMFPAVAFDDGVSPPSSNIHLISFWWDMGASRGSLEGC